MPETLVREKTIYGAGLIALDVVLPKDRSEDRRCSTGGTCANVLICSAYLGWNAIPFARLAQDNAGVYIAQDCRSWTVDVSYLNLEPHAQTPIIVEEISTNKAGTPIHRFLWTCPGCGAYLPAFRPIPRNIIHGVIARLEAPSVFFFDRVSRGTLQLAKHFSDKGSIIVFEPSGSGEPRFFREALRLAHILKYSHQRAGGFSDLIRNAQPWLQIETLGENGLRYRSQLPVAWTSGWQNLDSFEAPVVKDTAGCGDWCSAGLISVLGRHGQAGLATTTERDLVRALKYGQALAAWNCQYEGARGGMYLTTREAFDAQVKAILSGAKSKNHSDTIHKTSDTRLLDICPSCVQRVGSSANSSRGRESRIKTKVGRS